MTSDGPKAVPLVNHKAVGFGGPTKVGSTSHCPGFAVKLCVPLTVAFADSVKVVLVRLCVPLTVAFADRVMEVEPLTASIVAPDGMPVPLIFSPAKSPVVPVSPVTSDEPVASVPVKLPELTAAIDVPAGMPVPVIVTPVTSPLRLLRPVSNGDPLVSVPVKLIVLRL